VHASSETLRWDELARQRRTKPSTTLIEVVCRLPVLDRTRQSDAAYRVDVTHADESSAAVALPEEHRVDVDTL
jgi:hypothetical protein